MDSVLEAVDKIAGPYLRPFAVNSPAPESFWAALTASESGEWLLKGTAPANIRREEPRVFQHLAAVCAGFEESYGVITQKHFNDPLSVKVADLLQWGSSWGFTQVMGYHALVWKASVFAIRSPASHYDYAGRVMADFCRRFALDPRKDFEQMARCWNTGSPDGKTYSENYVPGLLRWMEQYQSAMLST